MDTNIQTVIIGHFVLLFIYAKQYKSKQSIIHTQLKK